VSAPSGAAAPSAAVPAADLSVTVTFFPNYAAASKSEEAVCLLTLSRMNRNQKASRTPRPYGQIWMIRRFISARLFPRSAGAKQKNHSGSGHYGIGGWHHGLPIATDFSCRKRQESGDKRLSSYVGTSAVTQHASEAMDCRHARSRSNEHWPRLPPELR
jgi:hypothetical protein